MPRTCTICNHPEREAVERALLAGESFRHIAARFDTSTGALQRHRADHLPASLVKAHAAQEVVRADSLIDDVRSGGDRADRLYSHAETILKRALESKDLKTALGAIGAAANVMREGRSYLELRGEITGELKQPAPAQPFGIQKVEKFLVVQMPKTPEAEALERERLAKFYPRGLPPGLNPPLGPSQLIPGTFRTRAVAKTTDEE